MYTLGIKRRFFPGFKKLRVRNHGWEGDRLIVNLEDGSQEQIPGFRVFSLKVYNDFHKHFEEIRLRQEARAAEEAKAEQAERLAAQAEARARQLAEEMIRQRDAQMYAAPQVNPVPQISEKEAFERNMQQEVMRRATKRVNDIFS